MTTPETPETPTVVTPQEARQGVITKNMRYVLGISLVLVVLGMAAAFLIGR